MADTAYEEWLKNNGLGNSSINTQQDEPIGSPDIPEPAPTFDLNPEVIEAKRLLDAELNKQESVSSTVGKVATRVGVEITSGMTMQHIFSRSLPYIKSTLQATRAGSLLGFAGPQAAEPLSTAAGVGLFAASEFGLWALANYFGQETGKALGLQSEISGAELISSGVFGMGFVTRGADKLLRLNITSNAANGGSMLVNGTKTFVSGAVIGVAESALRQEIEKRINDKDRDEWDYLFSGLFGGGANVGLNALANAFKGSRWGRNELKEIVKESTSSIDVNVQNYQKRINQLEKFEAKSNRVKAQQAKEIKKLKEQIKEAELAKEIMQETSVKFEEADKVQTEIEETPGELSPVEPEVEKLNEEIKQVTEDLKADKEVIQEVTATPEQPVVEEIPKPKEEATVVEEQPVVGRDRFVDDERENLLDQLREQYETQKIGETLNNPNLEKGVNLLNTKTKTELEINLNKLSEEFNKKGSVEDLTTVEKTLNEVRFLQSLNELKHPLDTEWGRRGQAKSKLADSYVYEAELSDTSIKERQTLSMLEDSLLTHLESPAEDDVFSKLYEDYLDIRPQQRDKADKIRKQYKRKKEQQEKLDAEKDDPDAILKAIQKRKDNLTDRLNTLRERFGDLSKLKGESKKNVDEDPEILELQEQIKFYQLAERDAVELQKGLAEEARLSELQTAPIGEQRAEVEPRIEAPKRPESAASLQKQKNAQLRKIIKDRIDEIDKAALELDPDFQAARAEEQLNNKLKNLQERLDELRTRFGEDVVIKEGKPVKEKHPLVKDYEDRIKFYEQARNEVVQIKKKEAERAEWIRKQTAPLGEQRAAVTPKPTGPKKADGTLEKLNKDIAFLKQNVRNRVREIDRARKALDPEEQAKRLLKQQEAKLVRLEKELKLQREFFLELDKLESQVTKKRKKVEDTDAIKEKKAQIKFYKDSINDTKKLIEVEKDIARLADIEGRAIVGEIREAVKGKPKLPEKPSKLKALQKKRADLKRAMRQHVADIDRAHERLLQQERDANIFKFYEDWFYSATQRDLKGTAVKLGSSILDQRRLSLINQLPSVLAGVPGGIIEWGKLLTFRPLTTLFYESVKNKSLSTGFELARLEYVAGYKVFSELNSLKKALGRTFKEGISATDSKRNRYMDESTGYTSQGGVSNIVKKAKIKAEKKRQADLELQNMLERYITKGSFLHLVNLALRVNSLGARGIATADEFIRRPYLQYRLMSSALKSAHLDYKKGLIKKKDIEKHAEKLYESKFTQDDGLPVLNEQSKIDEEVRQANDVFYFASDRDAVKTTYDRMVDGVVRRMNVWSYSEDNVLTWAFRYFVPFLSMAARGTYRMTKLAAFPLLPTRMLAFNPYTRKIKEAQKLIDSNLDYLKTKDIDEDIRAKTIQNINDKIKEVETIKQRRHVYNQELLADTFLGLALASTTSAMALKGLATGSLSWMTPEQREDLGIKPYRVMGIDYSGWAGPAGPISAYVDFAQFMGLKIAQSFTGQKILNEDQDAFSVLKNSLVSILKEQPLTSGIKSVEELSTAKGDQLKDVVSKLIGSTTLTPAQVRKMVQRWEAGDKIADMRGGSWSERIMWYAFGVGPMNFKTNDFGDDEVSQNTWGTAITRMVPRPETMVTEDMPEDLRAVIASDFNLKQLPKRPSTLMPGIKMLEWTDDDHLHLEYAFAKRLRNYRNSEGLTIKDAVLQLIREDEDWEEDYSTEIRNPLDETDIKNVGLDRMSRLMSQFYKEVKEDILEDESFLRSFRNKDEVNLYDAVQFERGEAEVLPQKPLSPIEALRFIPGRGEDIGFDIMEIIKQ